MARTTDRLTDGSTGHGAQSKRRKLRLYDPDDRFEVVAGVEPYAVYSMHGLILGRFANRHAAVTAMGHWPQGDYVIFAGSEIIARKDGTDDFGERKAVAA